MNDQLTSNSDQTHFHLTNENSGKKNVNKKRSDAKDRTDKMLEYIQTKNHAYESKDHLSENILKITERMELDRSFLFQEKIDVLFEEYNNPGAVNHE